MDLLRNASIAMVLGYSLGSYKVNRYRKRYKNPVHHVKHLVGFPVARHYNETIVEVPFSEEELISILQDNPFQVQEMVISGHICNHCDHVDIDNIVNFCEGISKPTSWITYEEYIKFKKD